MKTSRLNTLSFVLFILLLCGGYELHAQGTAFTYQGRLNDGTNPANGLYDLRFALFDAANDGTQLGQARTNAATAITNGAFTVTLDFGAGIFIGPVRWLEIAIRTSSGGGGYKNLVPRQPISSTPYAIYSGGVDVSGLSGKLAGSQIVAGSIGPTQITNSVGLWDRLGTNISYSGGNVGIGTTTPATKLHVAGEITMTVCNITSDRDSKEGFKPVNAREVLDKVTRLPISEWQYKSQADARHIGPMAQDFRAAFSVGRDEKHITTVDADGVALAAIQGLNQKLEEQLREKDRQIQQLQQAVQELGELVRKSTGVKREVGQ